jgi:tetratricopeptide (TPR) repeat protein
MYPASRPGEIQAPDARRLEAAWRAVLAGDTAGAEKALLKILARNPGSIPVETALAFARLRAGRLREASAGFEAVLARRPNDLPALIGGASAAVRSGDPDTALDFYRRAQAAHPHDATSRRRLPEVRLRATERRVAGARAALAGGDLSKAIEEYHRALDAAPEVTGLRLELTSLLVDNGRLAEAVEVLQADPGEDRQVRHRLGSLLLDMGEHQRALEAYEQLLAGDPTDSEAARGSQAARDALDFLQMPEEYRRIPASTRVTRADLAALVAVRIKALSRLGGREAKVAVDIGGSWAREHIIKMLALEVMDVYPNHTFQPAATVRRGDLARAVGRVLDLLGWPRAPEPALADMPPTNLNHAAAARVVAAGIMDVTPTGAFEPWRPVSGKEAADVIDAVVRLVGP